MSCPLPFPDDLLSETERAGLIGLAEELWKVRDVLAAGWSLAVRSDWLASAPPGDALSPELIASTAESFVVTGLERMRCGDFQGLSEACYETARALVSIEGVKRVSLADL